VNGDRIKTVFALASKFGAFNDNYFKVIFIMFSNLFTHYKPF